MAAVSKFSTAENLSKLNDTIAKFQEAIHETEVAMQAGVPGLEKQLELARQGLQHAQNLKNTYFPGGTAPAA